MPQVFSPEPCEDFIGAFRPPLCPIPQMLVAQSLDILGRPTPTAKSIKAGDAFAGGRRNLVLQPVLRLKSESTDLILELTGLSGPDIGLPAIELALVSASCRSYSANLG